MLSWRRFATMDHRPSRHAAVSMCLEAEAIHESPQEARRGRLHLLNLSRGAEELVLGTEMRTRSFGRLNVGIGLLFGIALGVLPVRARSEALSQPDTPGSTPYRVGAGVLRRDLWQQPPQAGGSMRAVLRFEPTLIGPILARKAQAPVNLDVIWCDGRAATIAVEPELGGILLKPPGDDGQEVVPVLGVRLSGPGLVGYGVPVPVEWWGENSAHAKTACGAESPDVPALVERASLRSPEALFAIDLLEVDRHDGRFGLLHAKGWAVDAEAGSAAAGVLVEVGDQVLGWIPAGQPRPDVATAFNGPGFASSGFHGFVDLSRLLPGVHQLRIRVVTADKRGVIQAYQRAIDSTAPREDSLPIDLCLPPGPVGVWTLSILLMGAFAVVGLTFAGILRPHLLRMRQNGVRRPGLVLAMAITGAGLLIVAAKWMLIRAHGVNVPFWDQWDSEPPSYLAFQRGGLEWSKLFQTHAEHRVVFTRALFVLLEIANQQWDVRLQMVVNAAISTLATLSLAVLVARGRKSGESLALAAVAIVTTTVPYAHENLLWGFQSQFYFHVLFSILGVGFAAGSRPLSAAWWLGLLCATLATLSIAAGALAPATVAVVGLLPWQGERGRRVRRALAVAVPAVIAAVAVLATPRIPEHAVFAAHGVKEFIVTVTRAAASPSQKPWVAPLLWMPFALLAFSHVWSRKPGGARERVLLALGAWVLLHAPAIALARGREGGALPSRYLDILVVGIAVNAAAMSALLARPDTGWRRHVARACFAAWLTLAVVVGFTEGRRAFTDLRADAEARRVRLANTRAFIAAGKEDAFRAPGMLLPYPRIERLLELLRAPPVRRLLPPELGPATRAGPLALYAEGLLFRVWGVGALGVALIIVGGLAGRRSVTSGGERGGAPGEEEDAASIQARGS